MASPSLIQLLTAKLTNHKQSHFTGVVLARIDYTPYWALYFNLGRLVWAETPIHPVRQWYRQVFRYCPEAIQANSSREAIKRYGQNDAAAYQDLHYHTLVTNVRNGTLNRIPLAKAVEAYLSEVLFDIVQKGLLRLLQAKSPLILTDHKQRLHSKQFLIVRAEQAWQQAQSDWQDWQQAQLVKCSPNLAPVIGHTNALEGPTDDATYQYWVNRIDGTHTLRGLALKTQQPLLSVAKQIVPYVYEGRIGLVRIRDLGPQDTSHNSHTDAKQGATLKTPRPAKETPRHVPNQSTKKVANSAPLIIYIDDSHTDRQTMGKILQTEGFRFHTIQESTLALPLLIERKPQLIFLDLVMPIANGYEICSQIRRVSMFQKTPIVIVTSNNSLPDRVKAKLVGASGFLSKPIRRTQVLQTVHKFFVTPHHSQIQQESCRPQRNEPQQRHQLPTSGLHSGLPKPATAQTSLTIQSLRKRQNALRA